MNSGHVYTMNSSPSSRRNRRGRAGGNGFYDEFNPLGSVSSPEEQARHRERQGYCTTCMQNPIKLYDIKKNKLNPLRRTKEPRTVAHQCVNGQCLVCNPHLDPDRRSAGASHLAQRNGLLTDSIRADFDDFQNGDTRLIPEQNPVNARRNLRPGAPTDVSPRPGVIINARCSVAEISPTSNFRPAATRSVSMDLPTPARPFESIPHLNHSSSLPPPPAFTRSASNGYGTSRRINSQSISPPRATMPPHGYSSSTEPVRSSSTSPPRPSSHHSHSPPLGESSGSQLTSQPTENGHAEVGSQLMQQYAGIRREESHHLGETDKEDLAFPAENSATRSSSSSPLHFAGAAHANSSVLEHSSSAVGASRRMSENSLDVHESERHRRGREMRRPVAASSQSVHNLRAPRQGMVCAPSERGIASIPSYRSPHLQSPGGNSYSDNAAKESEDEAEVAELKILIKDLGGNVECTADVLADSARSNIKSEPIQLFFLETLCSLCKNNEENKAFFMSMGVQDDVLNAMENNTESARIQELGCGAVWTLGVNPRNRKLLAKAGAAELVFRALEKYENNEKVAKKAVSALRTLSPERTIQQELAQYKCADKVAHVMALHRAVVDVQRDGCAFLSNASIDMDTRTVSVVSYEEMKAVVRALGYHTKIDKVASSAVFALKNYTYEEMNLRTMRRFHDLKTMLQDVSRYANQADSRQDALDILESIDLSEKLDHSLENIIFDSFAEAMNGSDAVTKVTEIMREHDWSARLTSEGLETLAKLAQRSDMHRRKITESITLEVVVESMTRHETDSNVQKHGCQVLRFVSDSSRGRSAVCRTEACTCILNAMRECKGDEAVQVTAFAALKQMAQEVELSSEQQENEMMITMQESLHQHRSHDGVQRIGNEVVAIFFARWN